MNNKVNTFGDYAVGYFLVTVVVLGFFGWLSAVASTTPSAVADAVVVPEAVYKPAVRFDVSATAGWWEEMVVTADLDKDEKPEPVSFAALVTAVTNETLQREVVVYATISDEVRFVPATALVRALEGAGARVVVEYVK